MCQIESLDREIPEQPVGSFLGSSRKVGEVVALAWSPKADGYQDRSKNKNKFLQSSLANVIQNFPKLFDILKVVMLAIAHA